MKNAIMALLFLCTTAPSALASGSHAGGHEETMAIGKPGKASEITQTIRVTMKENDDGSMVFFPATFTIRQGHTIRFEIANIGQLDHEFVLDTAEQIIKHKDLMEKFPEMEHDDPNAIRLEPNKSGEIVWTFTNDGEFKIACLVPGHYDAGMQATVLVTRK